MSGIDATALAKPHSVSRVKHTVSRDDDAGNSIPPGSSAAASLLGEVLARLPGIVRPMVHVFAACAVGRSAKVARELAALSARRYGRTLLVLANNSDASEPTVRGLSWLMSELRGGEPDTVMPDSSVPGLYHTRLNPKDAATLPIEAWHAAPQNFSMVVLASAAIAVDPRTIVAATQCHGNILAVAAGATRLDDVLAAHRQMRFAGARLLGTVLYDAPVIGFGFARLRRGS